VNWLLRVAAQQYLHNTGFAGEVGSRGCVTWEETPLTRGRADGPKETSAALTMSPGQLLMRIRSGAFVGCFYTGLSRAVFFANSARIQYAVLCYHGVSDRESPLFTTTRLFEHHLRFFGAWGTVATMDELLGFLNGIPVPGGPGTRFIITFDDGYQNVARNAAPLLRKYAAKATVYVNPEWIEQATIPWWFFLMRSSRFRDAVRTRLRSRGGSEHGRNEHWLHLATQVHELVPQEEQAAFCYDLVQRAGLHSPGATDEYRLATWPDLLSARDVIGIGSHTNSHVILGLCRDEKFALQQIEMAKAAIESRTQKPCLHFAYPRGGPGDFNPLTRSWMVQCGHQTAVTTIPACVQRDCDPLTIPRFFVGETPVAELAARIAGIVATWDTSIHKARQMLGRSK
jgi:peptidoglycan/xylan/chitin deacetylase (PgdA/CDA1 family)